MMKVEVSALFDLMVTDSQGRITPNRQDIGMLCSRYDEPVSLRIYDRHGASIVVSWVPSQLREG